MLYWLQARFPPLVRALIIATTPLAWLERGIRPILRWRRRMKWEKGV